MNKCEHPNGVVFKPDGVHELDPCIYREVERYANVTVSILKCEKCGNINIMWFRQEDTEELDIE